jgi:leucyl/phenylalanyl-tRNA--protein transferase
MPVFALSEDLVFPPPHLASPEGLLAVGGDLRVDRLLLAYSMGIFPWYCDDEPVLWWSPDPRLVLYPQEFHISRSLSKLIRRGEFLITLDTAFEQVMRACGDVRRRSGEGTWIVPDMIAAYCRLHHLGYAHSVEAWRNDRLVGGAYGVSLGRCFFGESMFSLASNASKVALAHLVAYLKAEGCDLIDCQITTGHLQRLGAREIPRKRYLQELRRCLQASRRVGRWRFREEMAAPVLPAMRSNALRSPGNAAGAGRRRSETNRS